MHCLKTEEFKTKGGRLVVQYGVKFLQGNRCGYFTVTADLYEGRRKEPDACGCLHEEIRKVTRKFDRLIALHLCGEDGVPMHVLENGFFYAKRPEEFHDEVLCGHFRVPLSMAAELRAMDKPAMAAWIETQRPRWQEEATAAITKFELA